MIAAVMLGSLWHNRTVHAYCTYARVKQTLMTQGEYTYGGTREDEKEAEPVG